MSEALQRYMRLRTALGHARWVALGEESDDEDSILDEMDGLWWAMMNEERQRIEAMVGLPHSTVVALGGVELRDKSTGEVLMRWQSNQSA